MARAAAMMPESKTGELPLDDDPGSPDEWRDACDDPYGDEKET